MPIVTTESLRTGSKRCLVPSGLSSLIGLNRKPGRSLQSRSLTGRLVVYLD